MTTVFKPTPRNLYQISFFNCQINSYDEIDRYDAYQIQQNNQYFHDVRQERNNGNIINQSPPFSETSIVSPSFMNSNNSNNSNNFNNSNNSNQFNSSNYSPLPNQIPISKTPTVPVKERKSKKYWTTEQKKLAVEKAKEMGLSKATKYLQMCCPQIFCDLSPSTLQYWIYKSKTDSLM